MRLFLYHLYYLSVRNHIELDSSQHSAIPRYQQNERKWAKVLNEIRGKIGSSVTGFECVFHF